MSVDMNKLLEVTELGSTDFLLAATSTSNVGKIIQCSYLGDQLAKASTSSGMYGVLATGSNLNNITAPGVYTLSGDASYSNLPNGITWGILEVTRSGMSGAGSYWIIQTITSRNGQTFKRGKFSSAGSFEDWYELVRRESVTRAAYEKSGLEIVALKTGGCILVSIQGILTEDIETKSAYKTICTLDEIFRIPPKAEESTRNFLWYMLLNSDTVGQLQLSPDGKLNFGFTRKFSGENVNLTAGSSVYCSFSYSAIQN